MTIKFNTELSCQEILTEVLAFEDNAVWSTAYYRYASMRGSATKVKRDVKMLFGTLFNYRVYITHDTDADGRRNVLVIVSNRHELAKAILAGHDTFLMCGHPDMYEEEKALDALV